MYGAIIGDIAGSIYERNPRKNKSFPLFDSNCRVTDDTVMTVAIATTLLKLTGEESEDEIKAKMARSMKIWGNRYLRAGYGGSFYNWLLSPSSEPYNSFGNGSAMRCPRVDGYMKI